MVLLSIVKRFISLLAFPGDPQRARKRALAALIREIPKTGPRWYEPWSDRLTSDFVTVVEKLVAAVSRADSVFSHTILADDKEREKIENALIDAALRKDGKTLSDLGFASIRIASGEQNSPDPIATMDALFHERLEALDSLSIAELVSVHALMLRLASFCAYRFSDISEVFLSSRKRGALQPKVPAADLQPSLEDLYFLIAGFKPKGELNTMYLALIELSGQKGYTPEQASTDMQIILDAITGPLKDSLLLNAIRAIRSDPYFEPVVDLVTSDLKKSLVARISSDYGRRITVLAESLRSEAIDGMLRILFGGVELLQVSGWTEAESETLMKAGMQGLSNLKSLSALKSFLLFRYNEWIRPAISNAIVELDFADTDFRRSLSDCADMVDRLKSDIGDFEESIMIPGQSQYTRYMMAMREGSLDASGHRSASRIVLSVKQRADAIVQVAFNELGALSVHLLALKDDLRSHDPRLLYRIPSLDQRRQGIAGNFADAAKEVVSFLDLLRMLAVDRDAAKLAVSRMVIEKEPVEP